MNIIYELNPPKILNEGILDLHILDKEIKKFLNRVDIISGLTKYIHLTDSVLGIPRISSIHASQLISDHLKNSNLTISCSIRTRDRNMNSIIQSATQAVLLNINGLLFIQGDKSAFEVSVNPAPLSKPTEVTKLLATLGFDKRINLDLSVPNKIKNFELFQKKIDSRPHSFITQSINTLQEIKDLKNITKSSTIKLVPCIMIPSIKNLKAASFIGLDWREYENNFLEFITQVKQVADQILITSPNAFVEGVEALKKIV